MTFYCLGSSPGPITYFSELDQVTTFLDLHFLPWRLGVTHTYSIELLCWLNPTYVIFSTMLVTLDAGDLCWQLTVALFFYYGKIHMS